MTGENAFDVTVYSNKDFKCNRCGTCCREEEVVRVTIIDIFRIAKYLNLAPATFFKTYCNISDPFKYGYKALYIKTRGGCPFYKENKCSIYEIRPLICVAYPFTHTDLEHSIYKFEGVTFDVCSITDVPYTAVLEGDVELLITNDLAIQLSNQYLRENHDKFNEVTAKKYLDIYEKIVYDKAWRDRSLKELQNYSESKRQKVMSDTSNAWSCFIYLTGFYNLFLKEMKVLKDSGKEVFFAQPRMHGYQDDTIFIEFKQDTYVAVKKMLDGMSNINIHVKVLMTFNNEEWTCISIPVDNKIIVTFCVISNENKDILKEKFETGLLITFKGIGSNKLLLRCNDALNWMSSIYSEKPFEFVLPAEN